jgi:hypothetical protein
MALEPQSANDYDAATSEAARSVLIEIAQVLGSYRDKFVVVGGSVPWLQLSPEDMMHVGTLDIDLSLDAEALGGGEYKTLVEALMGAGYAKTEGAKAFQLVRQVQTPDGGPSVDIIIDFLTPKDAVIIKNNPPLLDGFAVQRADGAALAHAFSDLLKVQGSMPNGARNSVAIHVASIPALLAMKGFALHGRQKNKDAYDVYFCVRNYPGGIEALAKDCAPLLEQEEAKKGYQRINEKFESAEHYGPIFVREFVKDSAVLDGRTPEQWQQDAFGQIDVWLKAIGIRT